MRSEKGFKGWAFVYELTNNRSSRLVDRKEKFKCVINYLQPVVKQYEELRDEIKKKAIEITVGR